MKKYNLENESWQKVVFELEKCFSTYFTNGKNIKELKNISKAKTVFFFHLFLKNDHWNHFFHLPLSASVSYTRKTKIF